MNSAKSKKILWFAWDGVKWNYECNPANRKTQWNGKYGWNGNFFLKVCHRYPWAKTKACQENHCQSRSKKGRPSPLIISYKEAFYALMILLWANINENSGGASSVEKIHRLQSKTPAEVKLSVSSNIFVAKSTFLFRNPPNHFVMILYHLLPHWEINSSPQKQPTF